MVHGTGVAQDQLTGLLVAEWDVVLIDDAKLHAVVDRRAERRPFDRVDDPERAGNSVMP
jgi:hypothetical protein